jgi:hypothetical protein
MGFPDAIAQAQRKAIQSRLQEADDLLAETIETMRSGSPHLFALSRESYDEVLGWSRGAHANLRRALGELTSP